MEGGRAASGLLVLPRGPGGPLVDTAAVRELLSTIAQGGYSAQLAAATQLSEQLETEEGRFRDVVGDPWSAPAAQRAAAAVGKLLSCVKASGALPLAHWCCGSATVQRRCLQRQTDVCALGPLQICVRTIRSIRP